MKTGGPILPAMALEYLGIESDTQRELHRDPTWEAALSAIDLLGGEHASVVRLSTLAGTSLSIGGGDGGRYVVHGLRCNGASTSLLDPSSLGPDIGVRDGRCERVFPSKMIVGKALVLRAAELFYKRGAFDSALSWDTAGVPSPASARP
jgi:hypothetical protein